MSNFVVTIPMDEITKFCQRWKIRELALFGSALRDDFSPDSDLDILVTFDADAEWGLFDHTHKDAARTAGIVTAECGPHQQTCR
jgi:predicted nucleotidyltransferase